jgi:beta-glucosidase
VNVKNVGNRAGADVVELYVHDTAPGLNRPIKELEGFRRVSVRPGEKKMVQFILTANQLAFYNSRFKRWKVDPGKYNVMIGSSSADTKLTDSFKVLK